MLYEINGYIEETCDSNGFVFRERIRIFLLQPLRILDKLLKIKEDPRLTEYMCCGLDLCITKI